MSKTYYVFLNNEQIGVTEFEKADAPMGVVFGELRCIDRKLGYTFLKEYCQNNQIGLTSDYPEDKMISTMDIPELKIINKNGVEIKGAGNQITGMDGAEYEILVFGVPYPFYEEEFPQYVKNYS